jgi:hypothetical protein
MLPSATSGYSDVLCTVLVIVLTLAVAQLVEVQRYKPEVAGSNSEGSFRPTGSLNRNGYRGSVGVKTAGV